jgi:solute carrier family 39 (zinc transporter), member 1/2/3
MLPSAFDSLSDPCLPDFWINTYTAAPGAITMGAAIVIFLIEFGSTRYLAAVDRRIVVRNEPTDQERNDKMGSDVDIIKNRTRDGSAHFGHHHITPPPVEGDIDSQTAATQKLGVAILEGGIIFHSVFIGLTLAVSTGSDFVSLFITIIFHRILPKAQLLIVETFEGLALGSRIATLSFHRHDWRPYIMALVYSCTTPIGIAIGLGVRLSYDPNSQRALISAGIFDAVSAGLLIYAGMVELLAHDFIHGEMRTGPGKLVLIAIGSMLVGCALMSLLGRWA